MANDTSQNFGTFQSAGASFAPYVGAVADFATGVTGGLFSANQARKNRKAQARENRANREFNEKMMRLQQQFAVDNWNMENAYNTPSAQMARMKAAGVNPDLYFSDGLSNMGGSIASPTAASSSGSVGAMPTSFQGSDFLGAALAQATVKNLDAETRKTHAEASIFETDAKFEEALMSNKIRQDSLNISFSEFALKDLGPEQLRNLKASSEYLYKQSEEITQGIKESQSRIANYDEDTKLKRIDAFFKGPHYEALINDLYASANQKNASASLSRQQCVQIATMLPYLLSNISSETLVNHKTAVNLSEDAMNKVKEGYLLDAKYCQIRLQNDRLDFDLTQDKQYTDLERGINIAKDFSDTFWGNISAASDAFLKMFK